MEAMTLTESKQLTELEKIIKNGQQTFISVGIALAEIRDRRLYRMSYATFADYLDKVWGLGKAHGYRLIDASEAAKSLTNETRHKVNLASASALSKVPPPKRQGIVSKIVNAGQKVTAAAVSKLAPRPRQKPPERFLDGTGLDLPVEVLDLWKRKDEAQALLTQISNLRGLLKAIQDNGDLLFVEVDFTSVQANLSQTYLDIKTAVPYAVCPSCNGVNAKDCETCNGRGLLSEFYWKHKIPKETKELTGRK